jgi:hypothetical protein
MKLQDMPGIVILFVVIAVILGVGATILVSVRSGQTADGLAYNATTKGLEGITEISEWQPTLAIIVIAAVVIGVIGYFYVAGRR